MVNKSVVVTSEQCG